MPAAEAFWVTKKDSLLAYCRWWMWRQFERERENHSRKGMLVNVDFVRCLTEENSRSTLEVIWRRTVLALDLNVQSFL